MKVLFTCFTFILFYFLFTIKEEKKELKQPVSILKSIDSTYGYTLPKEIQVHKNLPSALKSIKQIDLLEAQAKEGHFKMLEKKMLKISSELKINLSQKKKVELQECLSIWIKYFQKRVIKNHPRELFSLIPYNPELYKQYLLAIHQGFHPDFTYQDSSELLRNAIGGEI